MLLTSTVRKPVFGLALALGLVCALALPKDALANVFASRLESSALAFAPGGGGTVSLSYILNENADSGVTLKVYRAAGNQLVRTVNLGAQAKGTQSWAWDGKNDGGASVPLGEPYYFTVTAADDGYSDWTQISVDAGTCKYYSPRGVDVNKNPLSKYFGRIYVSENGNGTATWSGSPKNTTDGIYMLNADCTDAVGQGDTARTGGTTWSATTASSPLRCSVGEDDQIYVCDWTDTRPGVFAGDADFLGGAWVLDPAGAAASGLTANHGSIVAVASKGIGPSRVLYTADEDYPGGAALGSIWQYNMGNAAVPWWGKPDAKVYDDAGPNRIQNLTNDFAMDSDGNVYVTQDRSDGTDTPSVIKVAADQTLLYHSLSYNGGRDVLKQTRSMALDDAHNRVAFGQYAMGRISVLDKSMDIEKMQIVGRVATWAAGAGGTIVKSIDRGASWAAQTSTTTSDLNDVYFASYLTGVAVGAGGTVVRTTDGGATWAAQVSAGTADIYGVRMYSTTGNVWAVGAGGAIYKSANGGIAWTAMASGVTADLKSADVCYALPNQAFVCGNGGTILRTTDGTNWVALASGTTENLNSIGYARHRHTPTLQEYLWAVGSNGTILRSIDNGATWTAQVVPAVAGKNLKSLSMISSMVAKVVADDGTVIRTKDGGATWNVVSSGTAINGVRFLDAGLGWAVGPNGSAFISKNGGANWTAQTTGVTAGLNAAATIELPSSTTTYASWRDVTFDAAGNLYGVDPNTENLRIYSPPDGPNSSTTKSWGMIFPTGGDVTAPSVPVVTDDGTEQLTGKSFHATWTPATDAETGVVQYACAISGVPTDMGRDYVVGWTNVGTVTQHTFSGLDLNTGTYYFLVKAKNGAGIWGEAGVSDGISVIKTASTIGEIKQGKDTSVYFMSEEHPAIVTYIDPGNVLGVNNRYFWVESWDRSAGLKVNSRTLGEYFPAGLTLGSQITKMKGTMVQIGSITDPVIDASRELQLTETPVVAAATTEVPDFISMPIRSFGGGWRSAKTAPVAGDGTPPVIGYWDGSGAAISAVGLNTEGLLVRLTGTVTAFGEDILTGWMWCYIDDGSNTANEGGAAGQKGVKVIRAYADDWARDFAWPFFAEDIGRQITVDGISCNRYVTGSGRFRILHMRSISGGGSIDHATWNN